MENNQIFTKRTCLSRSELLDFVSGNVSPAEQHEIEHHLIDCSLCEAAVASLTVKPDLLIKLPKEFPGMHSHNSNKKPVVGISFVMRWAAALLIPVIAAFAVYLYTKSNDYKSSLSMEVVPLPPEEIVTRGEGAQENTAEDSEASQFYQLAEYKKSAEAYKVLLIKEPKNENYMLYLGISLLMDGNAAEALPYFEKLRFNSDRYYEPATWYLAMSHIRLEQKDTARLLLQELASKQGDYSIQAKDALKQIGA
jgi:tetratricopeptide (TPR) repeat protein